MTQDFDVCIRGAGIVGKTLALTLARERLRVALVQEPPRANEDVRAYALNVPSRQLLQSLRCWPAAAVTPVHSMQIWGDGSGMLSFEADAVSQDGLPADALAWIVDVPALEEVLTRAVEFQPAIEWVPAPVPAALTAICEGKHSQARQALGVEFQTTDYPQHAIATRLRSSVVHGGVARQWFTGSDILALLPLGGAQGQDFAVVWSTEPAHAKQLLGLDDAAFVAQLQALVRQHAPVHSAAPAQDLQADEAMDDAPEEAFTLMAPRAAWPLRLSQAQHWVGSMPGDACVPGGPAQSVQSWALLGDAAHTVHPLAGSGLNLGLGDVQALAQLISERPTWRSVGDLKLLRAYARARKSALQPFVAATDGLQQLFARREDVVGLARNLGMNAFARSTLLKRWLAQQAMGSR